MSNFNNEINALYGTFNKSFDSQSNNKNNELNNFVLMDMEFEIPYYQRPYSWKKENVITLLEDVYRNKNLKNSNKYYLGNITLMRKENYYTPQRFEIIDGQQRMTTCLIILLWLRNYLKNNKNASQEQVASREIRTFPLTLSEPDNEIFKKIITQNSNNDVDKFFKDLKRFKQEHNNNQSAIQQFSIFKSNWKAINKWFLDKGFFKEEALFTVIEFFDFFIRHVYFLIIVTLKNNIGNLLFLSINGKGLKLDEIDLIKSFYSQIYEINELDKFKRNWGTLIQNTGNDLKTAIKLYYVARHNTELKNKNWVEVIKKINNLNIKDDFESLVKWSETSKKLFLVDTDSPKINFWLMLFNKFNYTKCNEIWAALLIENANNLTNNKKTFENIFETLFKINFTYVTLLKNRPQDFAKEFVEESLNKIKKYRSSSNHSSTIKKYWEWLKHKYEIWLNDNNTDIKNRIKEVVKDLRYSKSKAKGYSLIWLILFLDETFKTVKDKPWTDLVNQMKSKSTIDHIIAQKNPKYKSSNENKIKYIFEIKNGQVNLDKNLFNEQLMKYYDIQQGMKYEDFKDKFLDKIFNLRIFNSQDNRTRSNKETIKYEDLVNNYLNHNKIQKKEKRLVCVLQDFLSISNESVK